MWEPCLARPEALVALLMVLVSVTLCKIPQEDWLIFKVTTITTSNNNVCLAKKKKKSPSHVSICYKCGKHNKENVVCEPRTGKPASSLSHFYTSSKAA